VVGSIGVFRQENIRKRPHITGYLSTCFLKK
jgi:hypothetical protein